MKQLIVLIATIILGTGIAGLVLNFGGTAGTIADGATEHLQATVDSYGDFSVSTPSAIN